MRISDEDLTIVGDLLAGITTGDRTRLLGDAVVEEIRALRKVAEAANAVMDSESGDPRSASLHSLYVALKEAGYDA